MANYLIALNTRRPLSLANVIDNGQGALRHVINALQAIESGRHQSDSCVIQMADSSAVGQRACAALVLSSASGSVGGVIAGTTVAVTASGGDTATATAIAAAINANSTVSQLARATNELIRATVGVITTGQSVNVCGVTLTGTNGAPSSVDGFDVSSGVAATIAGNLRAAINAHPSLAGRVVAVNSSTTLLIAVLAGRSPIQRTLYGPSTLTITNNTPTAGSNLLVYAAAPGLAGNEIRVTATGTGVTAATNGSTGLMGSGTGGPVSALVEVVP